MYWCLVYVSIVQKFSGISFGGLLPFHTLLFMHCINNPHLGILLCLKAIFIHSSYSGIFFFIMPISCSVFCCSNNRCKVKQQGTNTAFHKFPKETVLRSAWKKFCNRGEDWEPTNCSVICSSHFQAEDYQLHHAPLMKNGQ